MKRQNMQNLIVLIAMLITTSIMVAQTQTRQKISFEGCEFYVPQTWQKTPFNIPMVSGIMLFGGQNDYVNQICVAVSMNVGTSLDYAQQSSDFTLSAITDNIEIGTSEKIKISGYDGICKSFTCKMDGLQLTGKSYITVVGEKDYTIYYMHTPSSRDYSNEIIQSVKVTEINNQTQTSGDDFEQFLNYFSSALPMEIETGVLLRELKILNNGDLYYEFGISAFEISDLTQTELNDFRAELSSGFKPVLKEIISNVKQVKDYLSKGHGVQVKVVDKNGKSIWTKIFTSQEVLN